MFKLSGTRAMQRAIGDVLDTMKLGERAAAKDEAEGVLAAALPGVPVKSGALRDSGRVKDKANVTGAQANVIFGGDGVDYAIPVHERPDTPGHKFLERPFRDAEAGMAGRIARKVTP